MSFYLIIFLAFCLAFWHSIRHIFWHSIWHTFGHSIWHIFWHSFWQLIVFPGAPGTISHHHCHGISSTTLSGISSDIPSCISSGIYMAVFLAYFLALCLAYFPAYSIWHTFWHSGLWLRKSRAPLERASLTFTVNFSGATTTAGSHGICTWSPQRKIHGQRRSTNHRTTTTTSCDRRRCRSPSTCSSTCPSATSLGCC